MTKKADLLRWIQSTPDGATFGLDARENRLVAYFRLREGRTAPPVLRKPLATLLGTGEGHQGAIYLRHGGPPSRC
jgi:hypothetical protein